MDNTFFNEQPGFFDNTKFCKICHRPLPERFEKELCPVCVGYQDRADRLERALDICTFEEKRLVITGRQGGATCEAFGNYVMETLEKLS